MPSANIELQILTKDDDDGMVQLSISASNPEFKASIDEYTGLAAYKNFGEKLREFPTNSRELIFESGVDDNRYPTYLFLRTYIYDTLGHAGLEVKMRKNGSAIVSAQSGFSIATEVASINAFGKALVEWVESGEDRLSFDFYSGLH